VIDPFGDETVNVGHNVSTVWPRPSQNALPDQESHTLNLLAVRYSCRRKSSLALILGSYHHIQDMDRDYEYVISAMRSTLFMVTHLSHSRTKLTELLAAVEQHVESGRCVLYCQHLVSLTTLTGVKLCIHQWASKHSFLNP
jgi:hypothetical protein